MTIAELRAVEVSDVVTDREGDKWVKVDDDLWSWGSVTIQTAELRRDYGPLR